MPQRNKVKILVFINIILFLISLIVMEIGLKIYGICYGNNPAIADPILHHIHTKNHSFLMYTPTKEFGGFYVYYDSEGLMSNPNSINLKSNHTDNKELIVFLGDSFIEAIQVPYEQSFVGILERRLKNNYIKNYGISSYSPILYYLQYKYSISKMKPKKVFMLINAGDIGDDKVYLSKARFSNAGDLISIDGGPKNKLIIFLRRFYLAKFLYLTYAKVKYAIANRHIHNKKVINQFVEENPEINEITSSYILKIAEDVKRDGAEFILMAVPSKYNHFHKISNDLSEFSKKYEVWAKVNSIPFIDLVESFHKAYADTGKKLFFDKDIHFNAYGQKILADEIEKYLSKK